VRTRMLRQKMIFGFFGCNLLLTLFFLFMIIFFIANRGLGVISWEFITSIPRDGMTAGGIYPAIIGSLYLITGGIIFSAPLGILAAVYMAEYAPRGKLIRIIRIGVNNLAGVPSVVFGLFGLAVFVKYLNFGVSILSGSLTLGIVILPTIIRASEEALLAVPVEYREAALALGATRWQTIQGIVLPTALPGILTGCILGTGRIAGETAPILFTATTFFTRRMPGSIFDEVMALPYQIYALVSGGTSPEYHIPIAFGTAVILLFVVLFINLIAILLRMYFWKKLS